MAGLTDRAKGQVKFQKFVNTDSTKEIWYVCEDGFEFPVPLSDTEGAVFKAEDKGMYFMRWINAHMKLIDSARLFQN